MLNSCIWPVVKPLSSATSPSQSGPGSNSDEELLHIFQSYKTWNFTIKLFSVISRILMVKELNYGIVVSKFELQLRYYVHFRTNTLGKVWTILSSQLWVK